MNKRFRTLALAGVLVCSTVPLATITSDGKTIRITDAGRAQATIAHNKRMVATVTRAISELLTQYVDGASRKIDSYDLYKQVKFELRQVGLHN